MVAPGPDDYYWLKRPIVVTSAGAFPPSAVASNALSFAERVDSNEQMASAIFAQVDTARAIAALAAAVVKLGGSNGASSSGSIGSRSTRRPNGTGPRASRMGRTSPRRPGPQRGIGRGPGARLLPAP